MTYLLPIYVCVFASNFLHLTKALHFFQIHEYDNSNFLKWVVSNKWRKLVWPIEMIAIPVLATGYVLFDEPGSNRILLFASIIWGSLILISVSLARKKQAKPIKPLVYTARAKRLLVGGLLIMIGESVFLATIVFDSRISLLALDSVDGLKFMVFVLALMLLAQFAFIKIVLSNILIFPFEALMRFYYVQSARNKINRIAPFVIGITGSYGKTSTKEILAHILASKYEVLKTPKSFNTLMGISKIIREELQPKHRIFVVEMGAYKPGEIAKLCRLVKPQIGILTAIGPQHLERFKTIDNVAKAKYELIGALPQDGIAVFNGDDPICVQLSQKVAVKTRLYGLSSKTTDLDLLAQNIQVNKDGTQFEIVRDRSEPSQPIRVRLLGQHNVSNILAASAVALECELSLKEIAQSLTILPPIEHRLQLIQGPNGVLYLDDAYNSNPVGAAIALDVLASFNSQKFLVTPGMVELGTLEEEEHRRLGRKAATICDYVMLVGKSDRTAWIQMGLNEENFSQDRLFFFDNLDEARHKLRQLVVPGDVILFENDLPDTYY